MTQPDLEQFIATGRKLLWDPSHREILEQNGLCLTPSRFYNQIPSVQELREGFENRERFPYLLPFFDTERVRACLREIGKYATEFDPPAVSEEGFHWSNSAFSYSDAMFYYCFLRHTGPHRVLEVGGGYSTLIAREAASRNGGMDVLCIEPFPSDRLLSCGAEILPNAVQKYAPEYFNDTLNDGDILFIDSTHTVKASSDCCHIYLRILPNIRKNIYVHVHDVNLPKGLNLRNAIEKHIYWTEQYLLAAYLLDNPKVQVLYGSVFAMEFASQELDSLMQGKWRAGGGSFWFRLNGRDGVAASGSRVREPEAVQGARSGGAEAIHPEGAEKMSGPDLAELVKAHGPWFHHIELRPGIRTRDIARSEDRQEHENPRTMWQAFAPYFPTDMAGMRVLDIGSAEGFYAIELARRGAEVVAIDGAPDMIRRARFAIETLGLSDRIETRVGLADSLNADERFDAVLFLGLLYHLPDPISGLRKIASLADLIYLDSIITLGDEPLLKLQPPIPGVTFVSKWFPTESCILEMLKLSGFREIQRIPDYPYRGRCGLIARR